MSETIWKEFLLRRHRDERGSAIIYLGIFLFLIFIITFGYQIDMAMVAATSSQAQLAFDEAGYQGITSSPDYEKMTARASHTAEELFDNDIFPGPYYSSGLDGADRFHIWVNDFGIGATAFYEPPPQTLPATIPGLYDNILRLGIDPCLNGGCSNQFDTWGNSVVLYGEGIKPTQVFAFGDLLPRTTVNTVSIAHEQPSWVYIVIGNTFPFAENGPAVWGSSATFDPVAFPSNEPEQWPLVSAVDLESMDESTISSAGQWNGNTWPGFNQSFTWQNYTPEGSDMTSLAAPAFYGTANDLSIKMHRTYAPACDTFPFMMYKRAIVRTIDMFMRNSSYSYRTFIGIDSGVPDDELATPLGAFDPDLGGINPGTIAGPRHPNDSRANGSWSTPAIDHLRTIPIHPVFPDVTFSGGNDLGLHTSSISSPLVTMPWLTPGGYNAPNVGVLHTRKTFGFQGWVDNSDPRTDIETAAKRAFDNVAGGTTSVRWIDNKWMELCACHAVFTGSGSGSAAEMNLPEDIDGMSYYAPQLSFNDGDRQRLNNADLVNPYPTWCGGNSPSNEVVDFSDHAQGQGQFARNIVAGLGPRVLNPNLPTDKMLDYSGNPGDIDQNCDASGSPPYDECWRTPVFEETPATPPVFAGGNDISFPEMPADCIDEPNSAGCRAALPAQTDGYRNPTTFDRNKRWLAGHSMMPHSLRHAVDVLSMHSFQYLSNVAFQPYLEAEPVAPENKAVILFGLYPHSPITGANIDINGVSGLSRAQLQNEWRASLAWAACSNNTQVIIAALALDSYSLSQWNAVEEVVDQFRDYYNAQNSGCSTCDFNDVIPALGGGPNGMAPHQACLKDRIDQLQPDNSKKKMARISFFARSFMESGLTGSDAVKKAKIAKIVHEQAWSFIKDVISKYDALL